MFTLNVLAAVAMGVGVGGAFSLLGLPLIGAAVGLAVMANGLASAVADDIEDEELGNDRDD